MNSQNIIYISLGILFVSLFCLIYLIINHLQKNKTISRTMQEFFNYTENETLKRAELIRRQQELDGELDQSHFDFLTKLDNLISQSNIKKRLPFLNAEVYIISLIVLSCVLILIAQQFGKIVYGIYTSSFFILLTIGFLLIARNINYIRIEDDIIDFINLMENYSKTSSDIIDIFGKIYPFLNEPLRSMTQRCYLEGVKTGNVSKALSNFEKSISHKKFKEIIHNISVCSRYDTNYEEIIVDSRKMLQEYLTGKDQKKALLNAARIEYITIVAIAAVMFYMIGEFMEIDLKYLILDTIVGNVFTIYFIVVFAIALIGLFILESGKD